MEYLDKLGARIRSLRKQYNYTQDELAQKVGYTSRSSINKIEKGLVDIPQSKVSEFASLFNVSPTYILFGEELEADEKETAPTEQILSEGEKKLLQLFRLLPREAQEAYTNKLEESLKTLGLI